MGSFQRKANRRKLHERGELVKPRKREPKVVESQIDPKAPVPFGFELSSSRHTEDGVSKEKHAYKRSDDEMPIVQRVFELSDKGKGARNIARTLNSEGVQRRGESWTRNTVNDVLKRRVRK